MCLDIGSSINKRAIWQNKCSFKISHIRGNFLRIRPGSPAFTFKFENFLDLRTDEKKQKGRQLKINLL